jgi:hypothetical protein
MGWISGQDRSVLLASRFPSVPDPLQQPTLALGILLGGVAGVDLSGFSIYDLVRAVSLSDAVGQGPASSSRLARFLRPIRPPLFVPNSSNSLRRLGRTCLDRLDRAGEEYRDRESPVCTCHRAQHTARERGALSPERRARITGRYGLDGASVMLCVNSATDAQAGTNEFTDSSSWRDDRNLSCDRGGLHR